MSLNDKYYANSGSISVKFQRTLMALPKSEVWEYNCSNDRLLVPGYRFVCMLKQDVEQEGIALDDCFVVDDIYTVWEGCGCP